ncbi:STE3-domain-containing protein [Mycena alexandri]|uniref:STE3-domain-containing protein n=1 Tax=Mycena alexandri TaxID=1745969 RepID=A0AAD6SYG4_9AGAR|nr:STE3-domain-containing protein [Mycena alexandri]
MYFYTGAPNWVFSAFSFLGFVLSFIPLPWHLEAWNVGTCLYMIWTGLACLVFFINSIVWNGNIIDWSPAWCDISTHFLNGYNLAVPACCLCINRRLYQIGSVSTVTKTRADKRKAILVDLAIGLGLPLLQIPLQYVVQGHRYNIFEDVGCLGETYETPVAVVLFHLPPILVGCVSAVYCILSIRSFYNRRAEVKELLSGNNNLNLNRYVRLMCLASTDLFLGVPASTFVLWVNVKVVGLSPWISWDNTHSHFSRVASFPGILWRSDPFSAASLETTRWLAVGCAFIFFAYFGFADEAFKNYRCAFFTVAKRMGYSPSDQVLSAGSVHFKYPPMISARRSATLPVFIRKETARKDDMFDSVSDLGLDHVSNDKYLTDPTDYVKSTASTRSLSTSPTRTHTRPPSAADEVEIPSFHLPSDYPVDGPDPARASTRSTTVLPPDAAHMV